LGLAWFSKGNREKAIENAERAVKLEKDQKTREQYQQALQKFRTGTPGPEPTKRRPVPAAAAPTAAPAATPSAAPGSAPSAPPAPSHSD
jgi:tetratricopeptide (TPR) repeat protein